MRILLLSLLRFPGDEDLESGVKFYEREAARNGKKEFHSRKIMLLIAETRLALRSVNEEMQFILNLPNLYQTHGKSLSSTKR